MSLATNVSDLATRIATEVKSLRTLINGNAADLSALDTTAKSNLVAAINELAGAIGGAGASIDDDAISTLTTWSSDKSDEEIDARIATAVSALVDGAPGALDTLNELAAALGDDADAVGTLTTAISLKAPLDSPTLTGTPTAPTATGGTNTTQIATTAFVTSTISAGGFLTTSSAASTYAPLASPALTGNPTAPTQTTGNDSTRVATTAFVNASITAGGFLTTSSASSTYAPKASPTFTGTVTVPTPSAADNTTKAASTAYVQTELGSYLTTASASSTYATSASVGSTTTDFVATFEAGLV